MSPLLLAFVLVTSASAPQASGTDAAAAEATSNVASAALTRDPLFVDAGRLFSELEFEQAAFRYEQLGLRSDLPPTDRALVLMWLGTCQAKAGDLDSATRAYELALTIDDAAHAPVAVSPKVVRVIDAIRVKVQAAKTAAKAREEQTRDAQTREDKAREQAREEQAREDQAREDQAREEQAREEQAREDNENQAREARALADAAAASDRAPQEPPGEAAEEDRPGRDDVESARTGEATIADAGENEGDRSTPAFGNPLVLPLAIGSGAVAVAALAAAAAAGIFGGLDVTTALDPKTTQTEAVERYGRGLMLLGAAGAATVAFAVGTGAAVAIPFVLADE